MELPQQLNIHACLRLVYISTLILNIRAISVKTDGMQIWHWQIGYAELGLIDMLLDYAMFAVSSLNIFKVEKYKLYY